MDLLEKAVIRIEHWIEHNTHHQEEYEIFSEQLQTAGKSESAEYIRQMMALSEKSSECLRKALAALKA